MSAHAGLGCHEAQELIDAHRTEIDTLREALKGRTQSCERCDRQSVEIDTLRERIVDLEQEIEGTNREVETLRAALHGLWGRSDQ